MLMPSTKTLTLQQQIHWQTKIIKHDRWVLHTAKVHKPEVVKWHRHQLLWTKRELSESLKLSHRQTSVTSPSWLSNAFLCIHRYEGSWTANTGNGYYGGLQMDYGFMRTYGPEFLKRWGTADTWPVWAQIEASVRAHNSGRGFTPWPNTARACGLL